jgi:CheY-like chemotaxis protein
MIQILVIDDEDPIRNLLARMIELEGYKVWKASDCQSALKLLKAQPFDVVLCDVFLPDGNGVDFIREIKKHRPEAEARYRSTRAASGRPTSPDASSIRRSTAPNSTASVTITKTAFSHWTKSMY